MLARRLERNSEELDRIKIKDRNAKLDAETWSRGVKSVQNGGKGLVEGVDESLFIVHPGRVRVPGTAQHPCPSVHQSG